MPQYEQLPLTGMVGVPNQPLDKSVAWECHTINNRTGDELDQYEAYCRAHFKRKWGEEPKQTFVKNGMLWVGPAPKGVTPWLHTSKTQ